MVRGSPRNAIAHSFLAARATYEGRYAEARTHLLRAALADPDLPRLHDRLGYNLLLGGDPGGALREFGVALRRRESPYVEQELGMTELARGDPRAARHWFERALRRDPGNQAARDSIAAIDARLR